MPWCSHCWGVEDNLQACNVGQTLNPTPLYPKVLTLHVGPELSDWGMGVNPKPTNLSGFHDMIGVRLRGKLHAREFVWLKRVCESYSLGFSRYPSCLVLLCTVRPAPKP